MKKIILIVLTAFVALAWLVTVKGSVGNVTKYNSFVKQAQESDSKKLYEQSVELYNKALAVNPGKIELLANIKDEYKKFYDEELSDDAYSKYIGSFEKLLEAYPQKTEYWVEIIKFYWTKQDYNGANNYVKKAVNHGISDNYINAVAEKLRYMYGITHIQATDLVYVSQTAKGVVYVGGGISGYMVFNGFGDEISKQYDYIGTLNNEGAAVFVDKVGVSIKDKDYITRYRLSLKEFDEAGAFVNGLFPFRVGETWAYADEDGKKVFGDYEYATAFVNGNAAVKEGGKWYIINTKGEKAEGICFADIKLGPDNSFVHGGKLIIAKEKEKYSLYGTDFTKIGEFACTDIDIYAGGLIAYSNGGAWGFVNEEGVSVISPKFTKAKSFSNGLAAVQNKDGKWGFCNEQSKVVINYAFFDGGYFNSDNKCVVEDLEGSFAFLGFRY